MGMFDQFTDLSNAFKNARKFGNDHWRLGKPTTLKLNQNISLRLDKISVGTFDNKDSGYGVTFRITF